MESLLLDKKLKHITNLILEKKEEFSKQKQDEDKDIQQQLEPWRVHLIQIYADSVSTNDTKNFEVLEEWGREVANLLVVLQLPLDVALEEISYYRNIIGEIIKEEAKTETFTFDAFYQVISRFNLVVDKAVHWVSKSYMTDFANKIQSARYAIDELSIPVVRITKEIGVIPLVGDLDTNRAQILMENALQHGSEYKLNWLIIDLYAVPIIDTMVADQIFKVIGALRLLGIQVVLSGIRAEIAQTMVNLGLDLADITTFSSLHQAVEYVNQAD
ncbi:MULTISPECIES: STAS domain-containing protein [Priestia]|uniref:Stressosome protein RsbRD n=1 Tax=Priestia megaterium Q3 TaxID=1452722 RepID=A0A806TIL5_PRIMG|nr:MULTISPECIES: STAS domain-containing protein [Priestia]MCL9635385.1 STAS domain-containing protein [Bacillus zanthoxyli]AKP78140.1 Stressosome protein RsbRD [Priestia megaterium Q3]MBY0074249.1 STAS domain-containing protein [Priestia aryabhattai]MCM2975683.1 STAS domain-containing protein [Priestia aryabhattai]MDT0145373.1 STAS domain-containing protein [Priestia aryabhattai]